jgi:hypothetical protein
MFVFFFDDDVPVRPKPKTAEEAKDVSYFCVNPGLLFQNPLPFEWEQLADINCDRRPEPLPRSRVVVGRRIDRPASPVVRQAAGN